MRRSKTPLIDTSSGSASSSGGRSRLIAGWRGGRVDARILNKPSQLRANLRAIDVAIVRHDDVDKEVTIGDGNVGSADLHVLGGSFAVTEHQWRFDIDFDVIAVDPHFRQVEIVGGDIEL
jgi:hypothetical protein